MLTTEERVASKEEEMLEAWLTLSSTQAGLGSSAVVSWDVCAGTRPEPVSFLQHDNDPKQSSKTSAALLTPPQTEASRAAEDEEVVKAIKPMRGKLWLTCNRITPESLQHCNCLIEDHHF